MNNEIYLCSSRRHTLFPGVIKEDGGASEGSPFWICVFEGMGADRRAGWEAFFLLTKLR